MNKKKEVITASFFIS